MKFVIDTYVIDSDCIVSVRNYDELTIKITLLGPTEIEIKRYLPGGDLVPFPMHLLKYRNTLNNASCFENDKREEYQRMYKDAISKLPEGYLDEYKVWLNESWRVADELIEKNKSAITAMYNKILEVWSGQNKYPDFSIK